MLTELPKDQFLIAFMRGWSLFDCDGSENGTPQICRLDTQDDEEGLQLESDDEAWLLVVRDALDGDRPSATALRIIREHNPGEYELVVKFAQKHPGIIHFPRRPDLEPAVQQLLAVFGWEKGDFGRALLQPLIPEGGHKPSAQEIMELARAEVERLRGAGWTQPDFAKALKELLETA